MRFLTKLDIYNRALDHLGATHIANLSEVSVNFEKIDPIYDKVRRAELRRNPWRFAIKRTILRPFDTTTYLLQPALWLAGTQYPPGSIVSDANGLLWVSNQTNNIGNQPGVSTVWDSYFGQLTVDAFDATGGTAYYAGDLTYIANTNSSFFVYMSLLNGNTEMPNTADAWSATTTYQQDQVVSYSGSQWRSLIAMNLNNTPAAGPTNWNVNTSYSSGNTVTGLDGFIYSSNTNSNAGNNPVTDSGTNWTNTNAPNAWASSPVLPVSATTWVPIYAALAPLDIIYPLGVGPTSQAFTRNIFHLPSGYLRWVVDDPKKGINSFLGAPAGRALNDWEFESDYLLSQQATPLMLRFVADVQSVTEMDDMFCEGLAARIAWEACEAITNSTAKRADCLKTYKDTMGEARIVDAIEIGPIQPPEDEYITCRI